VPIPSFVRDSLNKDVVLSCFQATVVGRPRWQAAYLSQGLCRIKWLCAAGIVLWIVQAFAINAGGAHGQGALYGPAADRIGVGTASLINATVSVGIVGALMMLLTGGRGAVGTARARKLVLIVAATSTMSEALLFGLARLSLDRAASLDLALLIILAVAPLGLIASLAIAGFNMLVVAATARLTGLEWQVAHWLLLLHPLSFAVMGIVASRWYLGAFKMEQLTQIRLERHMRQIERQKQLIEAQKDEALRQRAEIGKQQKVLFHALASALTEPVAHAYVSQGRFPTELKTVCVIACDAVGFSDSCRKLQPERVVSELENFFREFDAACLKYRVEPLRAQGDSRIAIAGLWPDPHRRLHQEAISAVLAMLYFRSKLPRVTNATDGSDPGRVLWPARIGICLGPASCGVIDTGGSEASAGRLWFDVWGDTVNLAARLQEAAQPNQVLVRESVLWETCGLFDHGPVRQLQVKSTTLTDAIEILGIRAQFRDEQGMPNTAFWEIYNDLTSRPVKPNPMGTVENSVPTAVSPTLVAPSGSGPTA
jgi:class 3 adenylate cyclase